VDPVTTPDVPRFATRRLLSDCVHCGLCLDACPTYKELGHEPDSPRGRLWLMKALADGRLEPTAPVVRHLDQCLGCRACETACPSGVHYGEVLEATRGWLEGASVPGRVAARSPRAPRTWRDRLLRDVIVGRVMASPGLFRLSVGALRLASRLGLSGLAGSLMPAAFDAKTWARALDPDPVVDWSRLPGARTTGIPDGAAVVITAAPPVHGRALLLTGCVMSGVFGRVNAATAGVLAANGWEVIVPRGDACCGALAAHAGLADRARELAARAAATFSRVEADVIVTNAAGCGAMLKEYHHWTEGGLATARRARDVSELLAARPLRGPLRAPFSRPDGRRVRIAYHDACHLAHGQKLVNEPRALLAQLPGVELVPLAESDVCCGSAGSYNILEPAMARRLGDRKARNIAAAAVDVVVAGNSGCLTQIRGSLPAGGGMPATKHLLEILAAALPV
jgi:glycolate oxidase iron-sulfur subunit